VTRERVGCLARIVERRTFDAEAVAALSQDVHRWLLAVSPNLDAANFTTLQSTDLGHLFDEYDRRFFDAAIGASVQPDALGFRMSARMTSAGGKTVRFVTQGHPEQTRYEISVSTTLLYQCFNGDDHRPISVSGVSWINPRIRPGEVRKAMTGIPGKTGVVYTLDRETGEFLWATPTVTQNVINDIDGATGQVTVNAEVVFGAEGQQVLACPNMHTAGKTGKREPTAH
jgi:hypothetical protein